MTGTSDSRVGTGINHDLAKQNTIQVAGTHSISYREYGDSEGTPLIFFHGTPGSALLGAVFQDPAREAGRKVIAIDRPGYGSSSPWPNRTLTDTGTFVSAVLEDVGATAADLVGFSGGGPHALAVATTHPDRVRDLHLVGGVAPPSLRERTPAVQRTLSGLARRLPTLVKGVFRAQAWVADHASASFIVRQYIDGNQDHIPEEIAEIVRRDFVTAFADHRSGAVQELRMLNGSWRPLLETIDRPVQLWHGDTDTNVPIENARKVRDRLPDAELEVFENADHLTALLLSRDPIFDRDQ